MPEQKNRSPRQQQQAIKPLIEDIIPECLNGQMRKIAMDFVAYLRANKMKPMWQGLNTWGAKDKGIVLYSIMLHVGKGYYGRVGDLPSWGITLNPIHMNTYEGRIVHEGLQNFILDNVFYCVHSGRSDSSGEGCNPNKRCAGGRDRTILGKELKALCGCRSLTWVWDPDNAAIHGIKRLLELEQKARNENSKNQSKRA